MSGFGVLQNVLVFATVDEAAHALADRIVLLSHEKERAAIALSGGSTPQRLYRLLASDVYRAKIDWTHLHWFWGDERFVPIEHTDSNMRMAREAMLDHAPAPRENIHLVPTDAANENEAAALYEQELKSFYGGGALDPARPLFDINLLGIGEDGHTASLFPGKPAIEERSRWVVGVPEAGLTPFVPRVTLTLPAIASSRHVAFMAAGKGKRAILARIADGADFPAAQVRCVGDVLWYLDAAAAPIENGNR